MATFLILIYGNESTWEAMSAADEETLQAGHRALAAAAGPAIRTGGELTPSSQATVLRGDGSGQASVTHGPFLESTEHVGGYYVVEADDVEQVTSWVSRLSETTASHSGVEIRQLREQD